MAVLIQGNKQKEVVMDLLRGGKKIKTFQPKSQELSTMWTTMNNHCNIRKNVRNLISLLVPRIVKSKTPKLEWWKDKIKRSTRFKIIIEREKTAKIAKKNKITIRWLWKGRALRIFSVIPCQEVIESSLWSDRKNHL